MTRSLHRALLALLTLLTLASPSTAKCCNAPEASGACPGKLQPEYSAPVAAAGWNYRLVARRLQRPRSLLFDSAGRLLVLDAGVGVLAMEVSEGSGETSACVVVSRPRLVVMGGEARPNTLIISRGLTDSSPSTYTDALTPQSGRAQIRAFNIDGPQPRPQDFVADGTLLAWGVRNSVGLAEDPVHSGLWSVENSADGVRRSGRDAHADNPADELNFHGRVDPGGRWERQGRNYGFPTCYAVWNAAVLPDAGRLKRGDQFAADEKGDERCRRDSLPPRVVLAAHSSPLDLVFDGSGTRAFVSFHGSWDRDNPVGYRIATIPFTPRGEPSPTNDNPDAATDVLSAPDLSECPDRCFRPVGLALDRRGRLWFSSDSSGEIFVLHGDEAGEESRAASRSGSGSAASLLVVGVVAAVLVA
ncbi:glucose/sorbosone dehydrogenase [Ophiocordyceps camponoti-floridani]|uniref:Glucose/sorbosone dehydrogenase n=1 Tax=Ophiocordyceps camponoti-floridani TaxID=2030778 RepID=A0A8H4QE24_9HYPO|nr:glucose/sorbosone dehydrogenase [Ophiocordyceps camponoti-floridani]